MSLDRVGALHDLVDKAAVDLEGASAPEILRWADEQLRGRLIVATSMQDAVVVDIAAKVRPGIDVLFLDTGYHFAETIGMRDAVKATYDIRLLSVLPGATVEQQDTAHGKDLFARNPDLCCHMRKVQPLNAMLGMYDGWVTGLRRAETPDRASAMPIQWDQAREMIKVNPIVAWTDEEVDDYIRDNNILINPLRSEGYLSIGCEPCTSKVAEGEDPRSGRWAGLDKKECGLHI